MSQTDPNHRQRKELINTSVVQDMISREIPAVQRSHDTHECMRQHRVPFTWLRHRQFPT